MIPALALRTLGGAPGSVAARQIRRVRFGCRQGSCLSFMYVQRKNGPCERRRSTELADSIDHKLRLGKADALLLYVASLQTVILTLSQILLGSWTLIYYPAILLFVAVMPIYIGYVRGAITRNSLVERTRGWLYLIFGTALYLAVVLVWVLGRVSIVFKAVQIVVFFLLGWLSAWAVPVVGKGILNVLGGPVDESALESFTWTGEATMWMSFMLAFITAYPDLLGTPIGAFGALWMVGLSITGISHAERWARLSEKGYVQEKRKVRNGRFRWLGMIGIGLLLSGSVVQSTVDSVDIRWMVGFALSVTGGVLALVSLVLSRKLPIGKVKVYRTKQEFYHLYDAWNQART